MSFLQRSLTARLVIFFLLLAIVPLAVIGYMAYDSGRQSIVSDVEAHLESVAILKEQEIQNWVKRLEHTVTWLATNPQMTSDAATLATHTAGAPEYLAAHDSLVAELRRMAALGYMSPVFLLESASGQIIASSDTDWEGQFRETEPWFIHGKTSTYVSDILHSLALGRPTMVIAAPVMDSDGQLLGVLAGHANLEGLSDIMLERSGLGETGETYLVNKGNLLLTESRFEPGVAFKKWVFTEGARRALQGESGVGLYLDYREEPVIGAYRWLEDRDMALLAKINQSEAFTPVVALRNTVLVIGVGVALVVATLGMFLARSITEPVHQLVQGAQEIGRGNLGYRIEVAARDEIGQLAGAFNEMAAKRQRAEERIEHLNAVLRAIRGVNQLIVRERDCDRLLKGACENIIETRGYYNAWIVLLDESGELVTSAEAGLGEGFLPIVERLERCETTYCIRMALAQVGVLVIEDPLSTCTDCPLSSRYGGRVGMAVRLEYEGKVYGLLTVSVSPDFVAEEEQTLFREVADDIAFALHSIELDQGRKRAEEALRESEEKYKSIFELVPTSIVVFDSDGTIVDVNPNHVSQIGGGKVTREDYIGMNVLTHPSVVKAGLSGIYKQALEGKPIDEKALHYPSVTRGSHGYFNVKGVPLRKDEEVIGAIFIHDDITERKEAAAALKEYSERLEEMVEERTTELREANAQLAMRSLELQDANAELETFAYSVSHDLRAPLRAINGFAQIIARRHRDSLNEEGRHYFDNIIEASDHMGQLIDDLLRYSRLGRTAVRRQPVSVGDVLAQVTDELAGRVAKTGAHLSLPTDLPTLYCDWTLLSQIFTNLLDNALTYHRPGVPPQIVVDYKAKTNHVIVSVADNGIGIPPEFHDKIFNIFQRLHSQDEYPGTGVGLAIAQKATGLLGGRVWVESVVGEGSTFYVQLPVISDQ